MNSLPPIGNPASNPALPALPASPMAAVAAPANDGANTFLSLLQQSSNNLDSPPATPTERALSNNDTLNALLMSAVSAPATPPATLPIPLKLSLNIFGPPRDSKSSHSQKPETVAEDNVITQAAPPASAVAVSQPMPLVPVTPVLPQPAPVLSADSTQSPVAPSPAPAVPIEATPVQSDALVNIDAGTIEKAAPSELAFALRLTPTSPPETAIAPPPTPRPEAAAQITSDRPPAIGVAETKQSLASEQSTAPAIKPTEAEPAAIHLQQTQSHADPNTSSGSSPDSKGEDNNRGNRHPAASSTAPDFKVEQPTPHNIGTAEASPVQPPTVNAPDRLAASSTPPAAPAQTPQSTPATSLAPTREEPVKTGAANQLSFSVATSDQQKVEVRLMDRGGEVRVSVRAPNEELAGTLRQDIGSLTGKLNQSGYNTEAFTPSRGSADSSRDQKNTDPQQQSGGDRQSSARDQQQSPQQEGRGKRPAWLDELENSLATSPARKDKNR